MLEGLHVALERGREVRGVGVQALCACAATRESDVASMAPAPPRVDSVDSVAARDVPRTPHAHAADLSVMPGHELFEPRSRSPGPAGRSRRSSTLSCQKGRASCRRVGSTTGTYLLQRSRRRVSPSPVHLVSIHQHRTGRLDLRVPRPRPSTAVKRRRNATPRARPK